jgi:4-hydroxythreonine-4-phosphate dehydrogenase
VTRLVIVADDLTGAGDSAVPFAGRARVSIAVSPGWSDADVVAVDTESRYVPPEVAAVRVTDAVRRAVRGGAHVFKKIDSLLRGNVAVEVRAAARALGGPERPALAVVAAAFPSTGRTVRDGVVRVAGRPLTRRHGGDIAAVLAEAGVTADLARGPDLSSWFARAYHDGTHAVICDGHGDADLAAVVRAARQARHPLLLVGTGGLAHALSRSGVGSGRAEAHAVHRDIRVAAPDAGPSLLVIGSHTDEVRAQRRELLAAGWFPLLLPADGRLVRSALAHGRVVLSPDPGVPVEHGNAVRVARELARAAAPVVDDVAVLGVTGGETAHAVLTELGVTEVRVIGELEPGVVAGRLPGHDTLFVTKAGSFGDPGTFVRVLGSAAAT